jgi:hypothetical protein
MSRRIDSIRVIKVKLTTTYKDPRQGDITRVVERTIRMPNLGIARFTTCGTTPTAPTAVAAGAPNTVARTVRISWNASFDEAGGQRDVERYSIFRRLSSAATFGGDPVGTVAGGGSPYSWTDQDVPAGTWVYGVAAMDCGQLMSAKVATAAVVMP